MLSDLSRLFCRSKDTLLSQQILMPRWGVGRFVAFFRVHIFYCNLLVSDEKSRLFPILVFVRLSMDVSFFAQCQ